VSELIEEVDRSDTPGASVLDETLKSVDLGRVGLAVTYDERLEAQAVIKRKVEAGEILPS